MSVENAKKHWLRLQTGRVGWCEQTANILEQLIIDLLFINVRSGINSISHKHHSRRALSFPEYKWILLLLLCVSKRQDRSDNEKNVKREFNLHHDDLWTVPEIVHYSPKSFWWWSYCMSRILRKVQLKLKASNIINIGNIILEKA